MTLAPRVLRLFAPFLLIAWMPASAQQIEALPQPAAQPAIARPAIAPPPVYAPVHARPDDPWIYRGTDIPVDDQWLFGEMPNGLRYAVRRNGVPSGQVSIRVRIDAGSLHEADSERGFAHLIEHLTFRESRDFGNGEAIAHFQRLGAGLGHDTNATTSPTQTVYQLDLPNASQGTLLEETVRVLSGMIREPALSAANLATEVPIVLAERRERDGPATRAVEASREVFFAGQPLAERGPIGTVEALRGATAEAVRAFHTRWYRPDKAVVVMVGDADPLRMAEMIEREFGDWSVPGPPEPEPDFGQPRRPSDADPENPLGEVRVLVEPGQPRQFTYAVMRPWRGVVDNLEYNRGLLIDSIAEAIINRRLETRARTGGTFLNAGVERDKTSRSADATYVGFTPLADDWRTPLAEVRGVIADALAHPPSQAEIDRELAAYDLVFSNMVEQSLIQAGAQLADSIVSAVDIREAVASPETFLEVFREMRDRFTPDAIHRHTRELFTGEVVRALLLTPETDDGDTADLRVAMHAEVEADGGARGSDEAVDFADLPPIGDPVEPSLIEPLGAFDTRYIADVEKLTFPNGVTALLWPVDNEPGRATVRVRFGGGLRAFTRDEAPYLALGQMALMSTGMATLGLSELERITAGRKLSLTLHLEEGAFVFEGLTRAEDVADQLYLFAAKLAMPGWDASPVERARASAVLAYESYAGNPNGLINRDLEGLLHGGDPRFGTPAPDAMRQATLEEFERVWTRVLGEGPMEVAVFGDFDRDAAVAALSRTFGALPPRAAQAGQGEPEGAFPQATDEPLVIRHSGGADQAAAVIAWPTGGGVPGLPVGRRLELLADVFSNRLMDEMRERAGASYSPYVGANWPLAPETGGTILAIAQLPPEQVPAFFAAADSIAADLAAEGPSADELARVTEPKRQLLQRLQSGHTFWLNQLQGSTVDPNRLIALRSLMADYGQATAGEMQALAAHFFGRHGGFRMAVLPPAGTAASTPSGLGAATVGR